MTTEISGNMKPATVHYANDLGVPACGLRHTKHAPALTTNMAEVTCGICPKASKGRRNGAKACINCGGASGFYRDARRADGLRPVCKLCDKKKALEWVYKNHEKALAAKLEWERRPENRARRNEQLRQSHRRHPERYAARKAVSQAIRRGDMVRQPCRDCGKPNAHAHHPDYSKPLTVEWLCRKCHGIEHRRSAEGLTHAAATTPVGSESR